MFRVYAAIFALSGAAGLMYESVWSHYLKLILGHAAYAQTLVLAIFMGGMALGAWLTSRLASRLTRPLLAYALVEGIIGVIALVFHPAFEFSSALLLDQVLPALEPGWSATLAKLLFATGLILPQSLLLGATFPLLTGGIIRTRPQEAGAMVALLYFANSIGAVAGVLFAGFWLIPMIGLPGTSLTAGLINVVLALVVYALAKDTATPAPAASGPETNSQGALAWVLWAAGITGAASFCYEIAWIRMLSMVLGSSTHSFELMLAAFILGIALGGLWIKRRIDRIENPKRFLGLVQLAMGVLAVLTLPFYNWTFDLMASAMAGIAKTETGYTYFALLSHGVALLVMLPATFCAGMTLPLLTLILMRGQQGEKGIGQVYAANTLGSILGVLAAVHLVLPTVGLKGLLLFGTALDGALGAYLIAAGAAALAWRGRHAWSAAFLALWLACLATAELDPRRMGSGVYRYGKSTLDNSVDVLRWLDGKTASIGLVRNPDGLVVISTNGKPDAAINVGGSKVSPDEATMTLAAVLPMLHQPKISKVANIGFGSGMTTHTLLGFQGVARVETIEIEPKMVEAARHGYEQVIPRAFNDPRSKVHIDDARAYFSGRRDRYDLIVSEPSNPWVSGVSSLFSQEFYRHVVRYLRPDGLFVQWIQLYETGFPIIASITRALEQSFADYAVYAANDGDLLIVASPNRLLAPFETSNLDQGAAQEALAKIGFLSIEDLRLRFLGNRATWSSLIASVPAPTNSDYYPFIDQQAPRFRFLGQGAALLLTQGIAIVPVLEALGGKPLPRSELPVAGDTAFETAELAAYARFIRDHLAGDHRAELLVEIWEELALIRATKNCQASENARVFALHNLGQRVIPYLHPDDLEALWGRLANEATCLKTSPNAMRWFALLKALGARDYAGASLIADALLGEQHQQLLGKRLQTLVTASLLGHLLADAATPFLATYHSYYAPAISQRRLSPSLASDLVLARARAKGWSF